MGLEETGKSIAITGLRGIEEIILAGGEILRCHHIQLEFDNLTASKMVSMGSMREDCHGVAVLIEKVFRKFDVKIEPFWLSRDSKHFILSDKFRKDVYTLDD